MEEKDNKLFEKEKDYYNWHYIISDERSFIDNTIILNSMNFPPNGRSFSSIKCSSIDPIDIIESRMKKEPDIINYSDESMDLFRSYPINSCIDKTSSTRIEPKEMEFIEDTRDLFKLPIDYREWSDKNIEDWFYWIRHKLRFKYPKISKETIDFKKLEPHDIQIWKTKYGNAAECMFQEFSLWKKYKILKMKSNGEKKYGNECIKGQTEKPRRRNEKKDGLYLWQILLTMLLDKNCSEYIAWTDYRNGMFKIKNPNAVSIIWGESKGNKNMTYDKMSRSMRQYYKTKLLKKTTHDKLNYCFNMDDNSVKKFITRCRDKLPDIRIPPDLQQRSSS